MPKKSKQYEIQSFEQLINLANKDNIERLSIDFLLWLNHTVQVTEALQAKNPELFEDKTKFQVLNPSFIWIDDGKNQIDQVKIVDTITGEVTNIKLKK